MPRVGTGQAAVGQGRVAARVRNLDRFPPAGDDVEQFGVLEGLAFSPERQGAPPVAADHGQQRQRAAGGGGADEQQVSEGLTHLVDVVPLDPPGGDLDRDRVLATQADYRPMGPAGHR